MDYVAFVKRDSRFDSIGIAIDSLSVSLIPIPLCLEAIAIAKINCTMAMLLAIFKAAFVNKNFLVLCFKSQNSLTVKSIIEEKAIVAVVVSAR